MAHILLIGGIDQFEAMRWIFAVMIVLRLREGGRLFSPFRLFFGEHAGPGGGGGWSSDNDRNVRSCNTDYGGGAEVIYLNWCRGGGGGQVFWVDRIAPSKKIKTSTIWKDFCDKRLPQKLLCGGDKPNNAPPPPPTHTKKWHGPRVRGEKRLPT